MSVPPSSRILAALRFGDTAFPAGGFAFSQGLEGLGDVLGRRPAASDVALFLHEQVRHRWAGADRVALVHAFRKAGDTRHVACVDRDLDRSTMSETLREGVRRNGRALLATHVRLGTPGASTFRAVVDAGQAPGTLPVVQAVVWCAAGLEEEDVVALSGFGLVSTGLAAAVRLNLVGALSAQEMMGPLLAEVAACSSEPVADDEEIAGFSPFCEIAAARQARLPLRLFSN